MEKVKVSREVADAVEYEIQRLKDCTTLSTKAIKNLILHDSINHSHRGGAKALNGIPTFDLAEILINGYEVEKTPEEKLLQEYLTGLLVGSGHRTYANAIKFTLDTLGIEIKGINA